MSIVSFGQLHYLLKYMYVINLKGKMLNSKTWIYIFNRYGIRGS